MHLKNLTAMTASLGLALGLTACIPEKPQLKQFAEQAASSASASSSASPSASPSPSPSASRSQPSRQASPSPRRSQEQTEIIEYYGFEADPLPHWLDEHPEEGYRMMHFPAQGVALPLKEDWPFMSPSMSVENPDHLATLEKFQDLYGFEDIPSLKENLSINAGISIAPEPDSYGGYTRITVGTNVQKFRGDYPSIQELEYLMNNERWTVSRIERLTTESGIVYLTWTRWTSEHSYGRDTRYAARLLLPVAEKGFYTLVSAYTNDLEATADYLYLVRKAWQVTGEEENLHPRESEWELLEQADSI